MDIRLQSLQLQNFKGCRTAAITLDGKNATIAGRNGAGKTTVADAFTWLLFDKDSTGRTAFQVKPQDADGSEIHNLETAVTATLTVDCQPMSLEKRMTENWTKRRGQAEQVYTGNSTEYRVDGVPRTATEYKKTVAGLVDEGLFRMLTNPEHFNTVMDWKARRAALMAMVDPIGDAALIAGTPALQGLDLQGRTADDMRKVTQDTIRKINEAIKGIPPRIDELMRMQLPEVYDPEQLQSEITAFTQAAQGIEQAAQGSRERMNAHIFAVGKAARLRAELEAMADKLQRAANADRISAQAAIDYKKIELASAKATVKTLHEKAQQLKERYIQIDDTILKLRQEWNEARAQQAPALSEDDITCPTCGQTLPGPMMENAQASARAKFEARKAYDMERIRQGGNAATKEKDATGQQIETTINAAEAAERRADELAAEIAQLVTRAGAADVEINPMLDMDYAAKAAELDTAEKTAQIEPEQMAQEQYDLLQEYRREIDKRRAAMVAMDNWDASRDRIAQLKAEEKNLGAELAKQEGILYQLEELVKARCAAVEESINGLFPTVRWRLFIQQINGGITDTCDCLIGGVPYADANMAARINAGLEIITVLSRWHGVTAPIFIDRAESINRLYPADAQTIALVVTTDEYLTVRKEGTKE